MTYTERRKRIRAILREGKCIAPAPIYDPLSARVAETVGYEFGMLPGSAAASAILAVPDLVLLTLTELSEQVRRIMRASNLSLIVDGDHGYGNALNVIRVVEELEHAGVSAITIEDTVLPKYFNQSANELVSVEEMVGKLRAAVAARNDPALVIVGRTSALADEGLERTIARAKAYAATGIDVIQLLGFRHLEELEEIRASVKLPIFLGVPGGLPSGITREDVAARGVRMIFQGTQGVAATVTALQHTYTHLFAGGAPLELKARIASAEEMAGLVNDSLYKKYQHDYMS